MINRGINFCVIQLYYKLKTKIFSSVSHWKYTPGMSCIKNDKNILFFGSYAKFRKATISFVIFVRPSVLMEQLGSQWTDFH